MSSKSIAGVYFQKHRRDAIENVNFGRIIYNAEHHFCCLALNGWRQCHAAAIPHDADHPYLNGDIVAFYEYDESAEKKYQWCGWIWTESNENGTVYQIELDVDPTPLLVNREIKRYDRLKAKGEDYVYRTGLILDIHLTDKETRHG